MFDMRRAGVQVVAAATMVVAAAGSSGQEYPVKPIRVTVPFPAGGFNDLAARFLGESMARSLGQSVVVEPKPGAGGRIGADSVARAPADGYQLLFTNNGTHTYSAVTEKSLPYDPLKDFTPIAQVGVYGLLMVVSPSIPARNVSEFIEYAKRNPGKVNYGSSGLGSGIQFAAELFNFMAHVGMVHIPYKGTGPALQDVIAGNCHVAFDPGAKPFIDSGKVRLLGTTSSRRDPRFPDTPTLAEGGLAGYDLTYWLGMFGPAGLKPEVQAKLNAAVNTALADDSVRARLTAMGLVPTGGAPEVLPRVIKSETESLRRIAAQAKLHFE